MSWRTITLDGSLSDWTSGDRVDAGKEVTGYEVYGTYIGDTFYIALKGPSGVSLTQNTIIWLDTDLNDSTGYLVWGWAVGAEYHVRITGTTRAIYSGSLGQTVEQDPIAHGVSGNAEVIEIAIPSSIVGGSRELAFYVDRNDTDFLPNPYSLGGFRIGNSLTPTPVDCDPPPAAMEMSAFGVSITGGGVYSPYYLVSPTGAALRSPTGAMMLAGFSTVSAVELQPVNAALSIAGIAVQASTTGQWWIYPEASRVEINGQALSLDVSASVSAYPGQGDLSLVGVESAIGMTGHAWPSPATGEIEVSGFAPVASTSADQFLGVDDASLTLAGASLTTTATAHAWASPVPGDLSLSGLGIEISSTAHAWLAPAGGTISVIGQTANVEAGAGNWLYVDPSPLTLAGIASGLTATAHRWANVAHADLAMNGVSLTTTATAHRWADPDHAAMSIVGEALDIDTTAGAFLPVSASAITAAGQGVSLAATGHYWASPGARMLTLTGLGLGLFAGERQDIPVDAGELALSAMALDVTSPDHRWAYIDGGSIRIDAESVAVSLGPLSLAPAAGEIEVSGGDTTALYELPRALMIFTAEPGGRLFRVMMKHPFAETRVEINWSRYLTKLNTSIASSQWLEVIDTPLELEGDFYSGSITSIDVVGGDVGEEALIENRVSFADGSKEAFRVAVLVQEEWS